MILVLLIPQSRQRIQIEFHSIISNFKGVEMIGSSDRLVLSNYDWKLIDEHNKPYNLSDAKNKVVLINFWATWCPPCIAEMPSLQGLYEQYQDEVVFLFVTNEDLVKVHKFMAANSFSFKAYTPLNRIPKELMTKSIPRTFILNKNYEIVVDEKGALDWNQPEIHQLLKELIEE